MCNVLTYRRNMYMPNRHNERKHQHNNDNNINNT